MTRCARQLAIAFVLLNVVGAAAQERKSFSKRISARIDNAVMAEMERQNLVGVAVGIVRQGGVAFVKGYGYADRDKQTPCTGKTVFNLASNSKPLTAVLALQLVEQKKLKLDADVRTYVPEFPEMGAVITIRHLLCHQSGLPHWPPRAIPESLQQDQNASEPMAPLTTLSRFKEAPLLFGPGERMSYSSFGFILLSAAIERAGKKPFFDQIQAQIARPLGMLSLQLDFTTKDQPDWAVGYHRNRNKSGGVAPEREEAHAWKMAAGGFKSNAEDFTKFADALLSNRLLSAKTTKRMWTAQTTSAGEATGWGLGISVDSQNRVFHTGMHPEAVSQFVIWPKRKEAIVVMCNCSYTDPAEITLAIEKALHP